MESQEAKEAQAEQPEVVLTPEQQKGLEEMIRCLVEGDINKAIKIKEKFNLSENIIKSPEVQEAVKKAMINCLHTSVINNAIKIKNKLKLPENVILSIEVQQAATEAIIRFMGNGYITIAAQIKDTFNLSEQVINSPVIQEAAKQGIIKYLSETDSLTENYIDPVIKIKERFNLPKETVQEAAKQGIIKNLSKGFISNAIKLQESLNLPEEIINSPEVQEAAKQGIIKQFSEGYGYAYIDKIIKLQESLNLPEEIINSPEIQEAAKQGIIKNLSKGFIDDAIKFKESLNSPEEIINSPEVQEAAKLVMMHCLPRVPIDVAIKIKDSFNLPEGIINSPEVQAVAKQRMITLLFKKDYNEAIKIKESFNLPEEIAQEAAKHIINIFSKDYEADINKAISIKERFNLPEEIINSPEVQEAAKQVMIQLLFGGYIEKAIEVKDSVNLPEEVVKDVAKVAIIKILLNGGRKWMSAALEIKNIFNLSESITSECAKEAFETIINLRPEEADYDLAMEIHAGFHIIGNTALVEEIYNKAVVDVIVAEPQLKLNYGLLQKLIGEKKLKNILLNHAGFWQNVHDSLLFMERVVGLPEEQQNKIARIVLPVLNSDIDFLKLNELLGSFDVDVYIAKQDGRETPFKNFAEFEREAMMQKYDVNVPENASEEFQDAVSILIKAPGVDVHFIKQMIEEYDSKSADTGVSIDGVPMPKQGLENYQDDNEEEGQEDYDDYGNNDDEDEQESFSNEKFAARLINIIEGKDNIDDRQIIKPFETEMPFDPLNKLTYMAVGIHALNSQTPKYAEMFDKKEELRGLIDAISETDKKIKDELSAKKNQKIKEDPDKKDRYAADYKKALDNTTLLKTGEGKKIEGVKPYNLENALMRFDEERMDKFRATVENCLRDEEIKNLLLQTFLIFAQKGEKIFDSIDLNAFTDTIERAQAVVGDYKNYETESNKLIEEKAASLAERTGQELNKEQKSAVRREAQQEMFNAIAPEKILAQFQNHELGLASLLIYLGFNNRKRHSESVNIKKALDRALKQKKYETQNNELKSKGMIANNSDVFLSYLNGQLEVEKDDEGAIRGILKQYGYADMGRKLKVEIAKKSDPRGWVCGDYTNCCMPFTSSKNKEYALREDMSYFLISIVDESGSEDLVGQSVLVAARKQENKDKNEEVASKEAFTIKDADEIAIDNIEIANRATKYRLIIAQAYEELKKQFPDKKIVIGTSYNDDGGIVTGNCPLETVDANPLLGDMEYSDWYHHNAHYVYYDPEKKEQTGKQYFGLQIDMLDRSHIKRFIADSEEYRSMEALLEKIGKGEDDGDGGLIFPDNYSCVIGGKESYQGYIIAADYIKGEGEDDYIEFEKIHLRDDLTLAEKQQIFTDYLKSKKMKKNDQVDGLLFRPEAMVNNPFIMDSLKEYFKDKKEIISSNDGGIKVNF